MLSPSSQENDRKRSCIEALKQEDVRLARSLMRKQIRDGLQAPICNRLRRHLRARLSDSKICGSEAAENIIDVIRYSAVVARDSVKFKHAYKESGLCRANTKLARSLRTWRRTGTHSQELMKYFSSLCHQEALKEIRSLHASVKRSVDFQARKDHAFEARMADVRAEMFADLCSIPEVRQSSEKGIDESLASWSSTGWCGVNLGGWLLWEPGPANKSSLIQSLGDDDVPKDEWTLCEHLTRKHGRALAESLVQEHRRTHVTFNDFAAMKRLGINAVRVPFGYWTFAPQDDEPYVGNCVEFLDAALEWGAELGLSVVLCLHAAVGFQGPDPPCGRSNSKWHPRQFDVSATVNVLRQTVQRYGKHTALGGICILNEPHGEIPIKKMKNFFTEAYSALRNDLGLPLSVQLMLPIFHHEFTDFQGTFTEEAGFKNIVFDVHCYQVFGDPYAGWKNLPLAQHLRFATGCSPRHEVRCIADCGERVVVSEFSLALPTWHRSMSIAREFAALSKSEKKLLRRSFAVRQLQNFATRTEGFFFWSWRDDSGPEWSFAESCALGWMPHLGQNGGTQCNYVSAHDFELAKKAFSKDKGTLEASSSSTSRGLKRQLSDVSTDVGQSEDGIDDSTDVGQSEEGADQFLDSDHSPVKNV
mmetsp:Transcript_42443/g.73882  ORF Transcript_42443/g.73882 Transcript_42443/m.73882 type:complete len:645 (-) Transcript_42443:127-2061(-)